MYENAKFDRYEGQAATAAADSRDHPPVTLQRERLGALIDVNDKLTEQLYMRLEAVLAPAPPEPADGRAGPAALLVCPLAGEMRAQGDHLDATNTKLQRLLQRLEV